MALELPETYGLAAKLYIAGEPQDECYRHGCDAQAVVAMA